MLGGLLTVAADLTGLPTYLTGGCLIGGLTGLRCMCTSVMLVWSVTLEPYQHRYLHRHTDCVSTSLHPTPTSENRPRHRSAARFSCDARLWHATTVWGSRRPNIPSSWRSTQHRWKLSTPIWDTALWRPTCPNLVVRRQRHSTAERARLPACSRRLRRSRSPCN